MDTSVESICNTEMNKSSNSSGSKRAEDSRELAQMV